MCTHSGEAPGVPVRDAAVLGRLIRRVRKQQGLTVETLAALCGLSIHCLSELENGRETCSLVRVLRVLDALGIEPMAWGNLDAELAAGALTMPAPCAEWRGRRSGYAVPMPSRRDVGMGGNERRTP